MLLYLSAGWIESTPALLHWFLEQRPPGFPTTLIVPVSSLISTYLNMSIKTTDVSSAELGLISGAMTVAMEYQQTFCSDPVLSRFAATGTTEPFQEIAKCQGLILGKLFQINRQVNVRLNAIPPRLQLLHTPAFEYAALLHVAGACQFAHEQHVKEQHREARLATGSRARGSNRDYRGTHHHQQQQQGSWYCSQRSFAQLVVPPDHELVAAALGKEAVAAHARAAEHKTRSTSGRRQRVRVIHLARP